ncbi:MULTISPECIES: hypothetical protein [unclassified Candidatus Accumulibacter]|jgi:hypothetical protein|uniref:hypothetical protein n=1 Tax=unclassified Candidatus Accumulibacter TaxID=2619054 RepID=UPI0025BC4A3D|nr:MULTISPECIES: hypothetical protein [unclassified Candidatus Accumulibacter]
MSADLLVFESPTTYHTNDCPEAVALAEALKALRHQSAFAWIERQNSGMAKIGGQFVRFGWKGCSDLLGMIRDGR